MPKRERGAYRGYCEVSVDAAICALRERLEKYGDNLDIVAGYEHDKDKWHGVQYVIRVGLKEHPAFHQAPPSWGTRLKFWLTDVWRTVLAVKAIR